MTYVERSLHDGEEVIFQAKYFWYYRWMVYIGYIVGLVLTPVIVGFFVLLYAGYTHLKIRCTERAVTNWRVIQKKGIVAVDTQEVMMSAIETVTIHQSVTDRLMSGGTVRVTGRGGIVIDLTDVDDPIILKKHIEHQRMNYGHA
jgi:uncharacterized membrane protein YdbT with pleckstrin-like domain